MKKTFLVFATIFLFTFLQAQNVGIGTAAPTSLFHVNGALRLGLANTTNGSLIFNNLSNINTVTLNTGVTASSYVLTLPLAQGAAASVLTNNGSGTLTWAAAGAWGLTGNAGTVDGTNFIGTTDNIPFNIRVNNENAGRIDQTLLNTFFGYHAGNIATTGINNTANGANALYKNTTGNNNTANGAAALVNNTSGLNNTANGVQALYTNITGNQNTANGFNALLFNTSGNYNTANGVGALYNNLTGTSNTANGVGALYNTTESNNTANGFHALFSNSTGSYNTALGYSADVSAGALTNATAIGSGAFATASNSMVFGNSAVTQFQFNGALMPYYSSAYQAGTSGQVLTSQGSNLAPKWLTASSSWGLTGNAGTVDGTNFIGTTDNIPFNIRVNNFKSGKIDPNTGNTFFGLLAGSNNIGGIQNTANGQQALTSNSSGFNNTANGYKALLSNIDGNANTANGHSALYKNTSGHYNTANGQNALFSNTTGIGNTANGVTSLYSNITGYYNTANGYGALFSNTAGSDNSANGHGALFYNTAGSSNSANGVLALYSNTSGNFNTANGRAALLSNTGGDNNTALGYSADVATGALTNATAIGANTSVTASNNMMFGDNNVVGWGFGAAPTAGADAIRVGTTTSNGNGATLTLAGVWTNASDSTKKHDIKNIGYGLKEVMKLRPVTYKMKGTNYQDIGFIAQEVKLIVPEIVYGKEGEMTMSYGQVTAVLTKAMQEQQQTIEKLKQMVEMQQKEINILKEKIQK